MQITFDTVVCKILALINKINMTQPVKAPVLFSINNYLFKAYHKVKRDLFATKQ